MPLAQRLTEATARPMHGHPCSVGSLLARLDHNEADALQHMLDHPGDGPGRWTARALWLTCAAEGYEVGFQSIGRHRRRNCRCFRDAQ